MSVADDILTNYQHLISELTFITGDKGIFDVKVDDTMIYSKAETGRHAEAGEVLEKFEELVKPSRKYGE